MVVERRFGYGALLLAAGTFALAIGNGATDEPSLLVGSQVVMAIGLGTLGTVFASGRVNGEFEERFRWFYRYGAVAMALSGLAVAFVGVVLLLEP